MKSRTPVCCWVGGLGAVALALPSAAQVSAIDLTPHPSGPGFEIQIDFAGQYTGSQILLELTQGGILFNPDDVFGIGQGPASSSFLGLGTSDPSWSTHPSIAGHAADLNGYWADRSLEMSDTRWDVAYFTPPGHLGEATSDQTDFLTARIGLTPDAAGTLTYLASAQGELAIGSTTITAGTADTTSLSFDEPATALPTTEVFSPVLYRPHDRWSRAGDESPGGWLGTSDTDFVRPSLISYSLLNDPSRVINLLDDSVRTPRPLWPDLNLVPFDFDYLVASSDSPGVPEPGGMAGLLVLLTATAARRGR
ncbi:MAG: hypothetical protein AAF333_13755 [Planctomycetota bacterium]